jgi:integrase
MASLEKRGDCYRIVFRLGGRKFQHPLKTRSPKEARESLALLEGNLGLLERGVLDLPAGAHLPIFLLSGGKRTQEVELPPELTLESLVKEFEAKLTPGSLEPSTFQTMRIHLKHFKEILRDGFQMQSLTIKDLQHYVDTRAQQHGRRKKPVSPVTIRKEIVSFGAVWTWAAQRGLLTGEFPRMGLKYPKTTEKPPFQTGVEIERQIERDGLTAEEQEKLWDCLFLTLPEIEELLDFVRVNARYPFLYPMSVFAAHTGARRSEILRSRIADFDFASGTVLIHEKKRRQGQRTFRRVPLSPLLSQVMQDWFSRHPGGPYTVAAERHLPRARKTREAYGPLTRNEAHHHLERTLAGIKWEKIRGWHIFRHSFCSNCAARGVDQRIINAWVGHTTEEMVRRYRHLIPDQQRSAIRAVFEAPKLGVVA